MTFYLFLLYALFCQEVSLIGQASQSYLISPQMHDRIRENVKDLSKYLFDQLVGLLESDIKRAPVVSGSKCTSYSLIFWRQTPTSSMAWGVQLRNDSHSPPQPILNQLPCLLRRIGFFGREGSVLCNLWMGVKYQWEGILIDNVPVHHIHFIVHQGIYGFLQKLNRQEMSRCINQQPSVIEKRLIFDVERQTFNRTFFQFVFRTPDRLHESLKSADESDISNGSYLGPINCCNHLILLFLGFEDAFESRVIDGDLDLIRKIFGIEYESGGNYYI